MVNQKTSSIKKTIIRSIINTPSIVNLLDANVEYTDDLINTHVFPHLKIDYTVENVGTYIGIKIDYPDILDSNQLYKDFLLTVLIISNNQHLKTESGDSRTDLLGEEILDLFNWSNTLPFVFRLKVCTDIENPLDEDFYFRKIIFESFTPNSIENGVKINNGQI